MNITKTISLNKNLTITAAQFAGLLLIATATPALIHFQPITGPIVNAALFLAAIWLGAQNALLIGLIPSVIALSVGLLPSPLAPMVPFIMLSNALLIITFNFFYKNKTITKTHGREFLLFWLGVVSASILKFMFLFAASFVKTQLIAKPELAQKAAQMLSYPQLLTALAGAAIAYLILKAFKRT